MGPLGLTASLWRNSQLGIELTGRSRGISMERRLGELRTYVRGWMGYFGLAAQLKLFARFDQWIRRRIRMCYWKRWRHVRTRRRELIALGVPKLPHTALFFDECYYESQ